MNIHSPSKLTSDATATGEWRGLRKRLEVADPAERIAALEQTAAAVRRDVVTMIDRAQLGHIGGDLSVTDILAALYRRGARRRPGATRATPTATASSSRKGHCAGALVRHARRSAGFFPARSCSARSWRRWSPLNGHPDRTKVPGVETNTGPLGHGLPVAVGYGDRRRRLRRPDAPHVRAYCGDGELQEGSNWEAIMTAAPSRPRRTSWRSSTATACSRPHAPRTPSS